MNIFQKIGKSIYGPELYSDLENQPTRSSIKYYLKFLLLLTLVSAAIQSANLIPLFRSVASEEKVSEVVALFPAELTVKVKGGAFVTNVVEPYRIPLKVQDIEEGTPTNMVVIDTKVDAVSLSSFEAYDTSILINKDSIVSIDKGSLRMTPVAKYFKEDFGLNQTSIQSFVSKYIPVVRSLVWFIPVLIYLVLYSVGVHALVLALFWALFVWLLLRLTKKSHGYKHAYRVTIHALTLGLIINLATNLPGYVNLILVLVVVVLNFSLKKTADIMTPERPTEVPPLS